MTNAQAALMAAASSPLPQGSVSWGKDSTLDRAENYLNWLNEKDLQTQGTAGE